jgi:cardiolipin synthase
MLQLHSAMCETRPMHIPFPTTGSYPLRPGNAVNPLIDGVPAFRRIAEAVDAAQHSVWLTVTFFAHDFRLPGGRGSLFDMLDRAVARGLDVRVIFWRHNPESAGYGRSFPGSAADRTMLAERGSRIRIRWDRAHGAFCQHQKSWLIDAGQPGEIAFVGGVNLTERAAASPGHADGHRHDAYVEVSGPAATDVHHNFVQRWNEASERELDDGRWANEAGDSLSFPSGLSLPRGQTPVQIQRNIHSGRYADPHPSPDAAPFAIAGGERTIVEQYLQAIAAAREAIYIENQAIPVQPVAAALEAALGRGVDVVLLVPADPEPHVYAARRDPARKPFFDQLEAFGRYERFGLVGIAARDAAGQRRDIYVHGKIMLVDDGWATIGSCNLHFNSLNGHSEMNASFWDPEIVRALRCALLREHLDTDTAALDMRAALALYRKIAGENRRRHDTSDPGWQGLAYRLDPADYGVTR